MRIIKDTQIEKAVRDLFIEANRSLPKSLCNRIKECELSETSPLAKSTLSKLYENIACAEKLSLPICQDTGMAVLFAEIGKEVYIEGKCFEQSVNLGVISAYDEGYLRKSVVSDPLFNRKNTGNNAPCVIHIKIVDGDKIKLIAAPKGFGSENMSAIRMFTPSATKDDIAHFIVETVTNAGGNPCPPIVVGVGLGGTFEYCAYLAKKALARDIDIRNEDENYARFEEELLGKINELGIGPQGFGGSTTALGVNIETFPTHIASLPCAVNIGCHVTRHKSCIL